MKDTDIKETIDQINISEDLQKEILENVRRQTTGKKCRYRHRSFKRTLTSAAALLLAAGIISIPVQAGIRYLVKERMESIPAKELEAAVEMMESQNTDVDGFSRKYSQKEKERMAELYRAYQNGTFPEEELFQTENESQVPADTLCYTKDTGCFYLPDRDLTDEELLQIIDFNCKRDYALTQDPDVQVQMAEKEKEQTQIREQVQAGDGISETDAVTIAKQWMDSFFDLSTDGMEETIYLDDERFEVPIYHITYSIQSYCYYYFAISTVDGSIMSVTRSSSPLREMVQDMEIEESRADAQIAKDYQNALRFLKEQLGIDEDFENAYCLYKTEDGKIAGTTLFYYFISADGSVYRIEFCAGAFGSFERSTLESYQQMSEMADVVKAIE